MNFIGFYDYTVVLTYISLVSAVLGIIQTTQGHFTAAIICLMVSGLCDAFDGTVARTKKNRTDDEKMFGIQLDSLCDVISFGVFPAMICYHLGVNGLIGTILVVCYCLCALIRLAFFNVLEAARQKTETGSNKYYRGLPVTSASMIFPLIYVFKFFLAESAFVGLLHIVVALTAFLFILDFKVKKLQLVKTKN
jgi:CDP-diacylglycerol--serine O-phosphatidyltransferase